MQKGAPWPEGEKKPFSSQCRYHFLSIAPGSKDFILETSFSKADVVIASAKTDQAHTIVPCRANKRAGFSVAAASLLIPFTLNVNRMSILPRKQACRGMRRLTPVTAALALYLCPLCHAGAQPAALDETSPSPTPTPAITPGGTPGPTATPPPGATPAVPGTTPSPAPGTSPLPPPSL